MHPLTYYVDESVKKLGSSEICALIAVKTIVPELLTELILKSVRAIVADPILSQHNGIDSEWVPHFCNDHPFEVHSQFLRDMARMPFESYIVFGSKDRLRGKNEYDWYDHLARVLFSFRFAADKDRSVRVVFEQHDSKVNKREVHLNSLFQRLATKNTQRRSTIAKSIPVKSAGKDELPLCLPDYIGGCFMSYLCNEEQTMLAANRRKYEIVSEKIRWIKDIDNKLIYTSKEPFHRD